MEVGVFLRNRFVFWSKSYYVVGAFPDTKAFVDGEYVLKARVPRFKGLWKSTIGTSSLFTVGFYCAKLTDDVGYPG